MEKMFIQSKDNKYYKYLKKFLQKKYRYEENLFLVEGPIVFKEAIKYMAPSYIAIRDDKEEQYKDLLEDRDYFIFPSHLFNKISDSQSPQGIISYFPMVHKKFQEKSGKFLYLDKISDAGNMGTIIRTADAFNLSGVIISEDSCDIYNPKTIRATMASIFRVPIYFLKEDELIKNNFKIIVSALEDSKPIKECDLSGDLILVIGNEAHGVSQKILERANLKVKIPIRDSVDSLNAGVAAGIFAYEMNKWNI